MDPTVSHEWACEEKRNRPETRGARVAALSFPRFLVCSNCMLSAHKVDPKICQEQIQAYAFCADMQIGLLSWYWFAWPCACAACQPWSFWFWRAPNQCWVGRVTLGISALSANCLRMCVRECQRCSIWPVVESCGLRSSHTTLCGHLAIICRRNSGARQDGACAPEGVINSIAKICIMLCWFNSMVCGPLACCEGLPCWVTLVSGIAALQHQVRDSYSTRSFGLEFVYGKCMAGAKETIGSPQAEMTTA